MGVKVMGLDKQTIKMGGRWQIEMASWFVAVVVMGKVMRWGSKEEKSLW